LRALSEQNLDLERHPSFLGAGAYRHFIPSVIGHLISRGEFLTSYTPYQPEVSQGTLQSIYEYESLIGELTGLDVVSASHYDGATATAEASMMTVRQTRRTRLLVSRGVHPHFRGAVRTYAGGTVSPSRRSRWFGRADAGTTDLAALERLLAESRSPASSPASRTAGLLGRWRRSANARTALGRSSSRSSSRCPRRAGAAGAYGADIIAEGRPPVSHRGTAGPTSASPARTSSCARSRAASSA
jgi:hypothetical protein